MPHEAPIVCGLIGLVTFVFLAVVFGRVRAKEPPFKLSRVTREGAIGAELTDTRKAPVTDEPVSVSPVYPKATSEAEPAPARKKTTRTTRRKS